MPLTDSQARALKPKQRQFKRSDEKGLFLLVRPNGSKLWQHKFRFAGKEKLLSYGAYPEVSLAAARAERDKAREMLRAGKDPALERKKAKASVKLGADNSFETVAHEFIAKRVKEGLAPATVRKSEWFLRLLSQEIGALPVNEVDPQLLLLALKRLEDKGNHETAKKTLSFASRVFRFAVATGRAGTDPAALLKGALTSPRPKHYPAILNQEDFGNLLRAIDGYSGYPSTRVALKIAPHVFLRPGELRNARWDEVDLKNAVWSIPAERMKARKAHSFPLSLQVQELIEEAREALEGSDYVFPAFHTKHRPLSENTLTQALRKLGFGQETMSVHGFRASASSLLNESGRWNPDAIERALAHGDRNAVRAAYHRTQYWDERVEMMQWWSDQIDRMKLVSLTDQ